MLAGYKREIIFNINNDVNRINIFCSFFSRKMKLKLFWKNKLQLKLTICSQAQKRQEETKNDWKENKTKKKKLFFFIKTKQ